MPLRILVDEDSQAKLLVKKLRLAGLDVISAQDSGLNGQLNPEILAFAIEQNRVVLTRNGADFRELHLRVMIHPGIFIVHGHPDPAKTLSYEAIVISIGNLEASGMPLANETHALESWNYPQVV